MEYKSPPGTFDILPKDSKEKWHECHLWHHAETIFRQTAAHYGYQEIRTPLLERTELFSRSVGEGTDIVSKEMYTFQDKGGRSLTLRPEGTAPIARAFIEHHLSHESSLQRLFYIGPMFRYDRPQAGRYRQFHQFGAEAIGNSSPEQDVELIDMLVTLYSRLGLDNLTVMLSSIGDTECRKNYRNVLSDYLHKYKDELSEDSRRRLKINPMRVLDSKEQQDREIVKNAPSILDFLNDECRDHFEKVKRLLDALKIPYQINDRIVRGLDYYNRTVYEVTAEELGSQNSVGGGGRYDGLLKTLHGPDLPATGFAVGVERLLQVMLGQNVPLPQPYRPTLFLIPIGDSASTLCFSLLHALRSNGVHALMDFSGRKLNKVMTYANQIGAKFVAVVGDREIETQQVELKDMDTGKTWAAPLFHLARIMRIEAEGEDFIKVWKEMLAPFEQPMEAKFFISRLQQSIEGTKQLTKELQGALESMQDLL